MLTLNAVIIGKNHKLKINIFTAHDDHYRHDSSFPHAHGIL